MGEVAGEKPTLLGSRGDRSVIAGFRYRLESMEQTPERRHCWPTSGSGRETDGAKVRFSI